MFERRRGVGIDRSHPLKPIASSTSTITTVTTKSTPAQNPSTMRRLAGGANPVATTRRAIITTKQTTTTSSSMRNSHSNPDAFASNGNLFGSDLDEMDNLESETFPKEFSSLSLDNTRIMGSVVHDGNNNLNRTTNGMGRRDIMDTTITISKRPNTNGIKLNPVITKKSPNTTRTTITTTGQSRTPPSSGSRVSTINRNATPTNGSMTTKSPAVKKATTTGTTGAKGVKVCKVMIIN